MGARGRGGAGEEFNADVSDPWKIFCTLFKLKNIVKELTCYKNPENPSCIDLFLTSCPRSLHNTSLYETGLSDFHNSLWLFYEQVLNHYLLKSLNTEITKIAMKIESDVLNRCIKQITSLWISSNWHFWVF